jgi:hypothetical protein
LSLLGKYVDERAPVLAVFVTPSVSVARVTETIRISVVDVVGPHLIVGKDDGTSDQIKFRLSDCEFSYGDFVTPLLKILARTSLKDFWS